MSDMKELVYDKVIEVLNLNTQGITFEGGYAIGLWNGIPYTIDKSSTNQFDWARKEVNPTSEEYNQEQSSVNKADRSDFIAQYQVECRLQNFTKTQTALEEFRDYMLANKQHIINGYKVAFKVNRGDKQQTVRDDGGNYYVRYKISVYYTMIKNGYILKDTDKIEMKVSTDTTYQELILSEDTFSSSYNPSISNATEVSKARNTTLTTSDSIRIFYNSTALEKEIYRIIKGRKTGTNIFDIKETFDGMTFTYRITITGGARSVQPNGIIILEFNWAEYDE